LTQRDDLAEVVYELKTITEKEKEIKKEKDSLRSKLFQYGVNWYEGREYLLPTTTVTVPDSFWKLTGMDSETFLASRFPTWDLISVESIPSLNQTVFVLRKNPIYMPFSWDDDEIKLSKTVTEPTPEIDFKTLAEARPDLFKKITREVVTREIDGDALEKEIADNPETISVLLMHTKYMREPQQRVGIKEL